MTSTDDVAQTFLTARTDVPATPVPPAQEPGQPASHFPAGSFGGERICAHRTAALVNLTNCLPPDGLVLPSERTINQILARQGC